jgi:hypothetical protein
MLSQTAAIAKPVTDAKRSVSSGGAAADVPATVRNAKADDGKAVYLPIDAHDADSEGDSAQSTAAMNALESALRSQQQPQSSSTPAARQPKSSFVRAVAAAMEHYVESAIMPTDDHVWNCCNCRGFVCMTMCNSKSYRCIKGLVYAVLFTAAVGCIVAFGVASQIGGG